MRRYRFEILDQSSTDDEWDLLTVNYPVRSDYSDHIPPRDHVLIVPGYVLLYTSCTHSFFPTHTIAKPAKC